MGKYENKINDIIRAILINKFEEGHTRREKKKETKKTLWLGI